MKCPKCGNKARKLGTRPVIRKGAGNKRVQAWLCTSPLCYHQWTEKEVK